MSKCFVFLLYIFAVLKSHLFSCLLFEMGLNYTCCCTVHSVGIESPMVPMLQASVTGPAKGASSLPSHAAAVVSPSKLGSAQPSSYARSSMVSSSYQTSSYSQSGIQSSGYSKPSTGKSYQGTFGASSRHQASRSQYDSTDYKTATKTDSSYASYQSYGSSNASAKAVSHGRPSGQGSYAAAGTSSLYSKAAGYDSGYSSMTRTDAGASSTYGGYDESGYYVDETGQSYDSSGYGNLNPSQSSYGYYSEYDSSSTASYKPASKPAPYSGSAPAFSVKSGSTTDQYYTASAKAGPYTGHGTGDYWSGDDQGQHYGEMGGDYSDEGYRGGSYGGYDDGSYPAVSGDAGFYGDEGYDALGLYSAGNKSGYGTGRPAGTTTQKAPVRGAPGASAYQGSYGTLSSGISAGDTASRQTPRGSGFGESSYGITSSHSGTTSQSSLKSAAGNYMSTRNGGGPVSTAGRKSTGIVPSGSHRTPRIDGFTSYQTGSSYDAGLSVISLRPDSEGPHTQWSSESQGGAVDAQRWSDKAGTTDAPRQQQWATEKTGFSDVQKTSRWSDGRDGTANTQQTPGWADRSADIRGSSSQWSDDKPVSGDTQRPPRWSTRSDPQRTETSSRSGTSKSATSGPQVFDYGHQDCDEIQAARLSDRSYYLSNVDVARPALVALKTTLPSTDHRRTASSIDSDWQTQRDGSRSSSLRREDRKDMTRAAPSGRSWHDSGSSSDTYDRRKTSSYSENSSFSSDRHREGSSTQGRPPQDRRYAAEAGPGSRSLSAGQRYGESNHGSTGRMDRDSFYSKTTSVCAWFACNIFIELITFCLLI